MNKYLYAIKKLNTTSWIKWWLENKKVTVLPKGYTRLNYIESTGTQYIDTGVVPDNSTGFMIKLSLPDVQTDLFRFGCRQDSENTRFVLGNHFGSAYFGFGKAIAAEELYLFPLEQNKVFIAYLNYFNDRYAYIDNRNKVGVEDISSVAFTYPLIMFGRNNGGNINSSAQTIYACQITKGNSLVRNFIPCKNANNEVGMYDLVTKSFFSNKGTGVFIGG